MLRFALIGLVLAAAGGQPAQACSVAIGLAPPEPPPGLSHEQQVQFLRDWEEGEARRQALETAQWQLAYQAGKWDAADGIFVARIDAVHPYTKQTKWGYSLDLVHVEMQPLRWIKGGGDLLPFQLTATSIDSCGSYYPYWKGLGGKPGEEFVVYFRGSAPSQDTVLEAIAPANIVEPRTITALTATAE